MTIRVFWRAKWEVGKVSGFKKLVKFATRKKSNILLPSDFHTPSIRWELAAENS